MDTNHDGLIDIEGILGKLKITKKKTIIFGFFFEEFIRKLF
jgi:hypothetical protein